MYAQNKIAGSSSLTMLSLGRMITSVTDVVRTCQDVLLNGRKRTRNESLDDNDLDCEMGIVQPEFCEPKRRNVDEGSRLVASRANSDHVHRILGWLAKDEVSAIGIYGMGGIGKTTLAKQLHDQLLNPFADRVYYAVDTGWVSVGMEFSVDHLQLNIAKAFGLDLRDEKDANRRAAALNAFLNRSSKCVLILDDVWGDFRREQVGIPKHCKLVLTSRSLDVCRIMRCHKLIKVAPLLEEEAWLLFSCSLRSNVLDSEEVTRIAELLCRQCAGVPLAIISLAKSMRGVVDATRWSKALMSLNKIPEGLTALENTITVLKRSYDTLRTPKLKLCFLYCAVYPKGYAISRENLIHLWIGEMLIDDVLPLQAQYDMGHSMLNKLLNSCLLDSCEDYSRVKMHDLVRKMALSISRDCFMVKDETLLKELTEPEWQKALRVLSLIDSNLQIPSVAFLKCHNLSALLLQNNPLQAFPDSFFLEMRSLRILNLSDTPIQTLPSSISALEELRVLDVSWCVNLKQVPSLEKLQKLRILDISHTAIGQVPCCIEMLKLLTELNTSTIPGLSKFLMGALSTLSRLRRLACNVVGIVEELQRLQSLEVLDARFVNLTELSCYIRSQHWRSLESYHLQVHHDMDFNGPYSKRVTLQNCSLISPDGKDIVLPDDIRELYVDDCRGFGSLSDIMNPVGGIGGANSCQSTRGIAGNMRVSGFRQQGAFSSLEKCTISRCPDIAELFTAACMQNLQQIEIIEVQDCGQLKELVAEDVRGGHAVIKLPQLKRIALTRLPLLNYIYKGQLVCDSLQSLSLEDCPKLNHLPFSIVHDGEELSSTTLLCIEDKKIGGSCWSGANLSLKHP